MTTTYNLRASTNVSFRLTRDLSSLSGVYDVAASTIRMQARLTAVSADPPVYEWCSSNIQGGVAAFNTSTGFCVFSAPESDMAQMPARLVYDCRLELTSGAIVPLFAGWLLFSQGVTRTASQSGAGGGPALTDTVAVEGEAETLAALPLSLTAVLANAQSAQSAAQASAQAASQAAVQAASGASSSSSLISALIYG
jgi:hypothetical protein